MNFSIIVPAYNAEKTIGETLESVVNQSYRAWQAIVVDDGSTDGTANIVRRYAERDPRIRMIQQPNGGEAAARNTGLSQAECEWLLFLDADDWISPLYLERMTTALSANPELDAIHCRSVRVAADGTEVTDNYLPPTGDMFNTLARRAAFPVHACIVRKTLVDAVGRFDTSFKKSTDWDLWQRVARTGARFGTVEEVLAYYRMQPNSSSLEAEQLFADGLRVLKQGESPDPRVPNPHPDHVNGFSVQDLQSQEFYLLCWCAGLQLGRGEDARPLLKLLKKDDAARLYPDAVAQCIFEAAPLTVSQTPAVWEELWPKLEHRVQEFFVALEERSKTPDLASQALNELKKMILRHSKTWGSVIKEWDETAAIRQALIAQLDQNRVAAEKDRENWQRLAEERRRLIEVIDEQKTAVEREVNHWQQLASERGQMVNRLRGQFWVRLGGRLRMIDLPPNWDPHRSLENLSSSAGSKVKE